MFGYVRPCKAELKVRELALFQAAYCGLCHNLKKLGGLPARFAVNYDFTVLAMLLGDAPAEDNICRRRCIASPLKKRSCCKHEGAAGEAAELSLVLFWWKLEDSIRDDGFFRRMLARLVRILLHRGMKASRQRHPDFDRLCMEKLRQLSELEQEGCSSLDRAADPFAAILAGAADAADDPRKQRILRELLYHLGRFVYLADAAADLEEDRKAGRYNPVAVRYGSSFGDLERQQLLDTLHASAVQAANALDLLEETPYTAILENIFTLGMPETAVKILRGEALGKEKKWRIG